MRNVTAAKRLSRYRDAFVDIAGLAEAPNIAFTAADHEEELLSDFEVDELTILATLKNSILKLNQHDHTAQVMTMLRSLAGIDMLTASRAITENPREVGRNVKILAPFIIAAATYLDHRVDYTDTQLPFVSRIDVTEVKPREPEAVVEHVAEHYPSYRLLAPLMGPDIRRGLQGSMLAAYMNPKNS